MAIGRKNSMVQKVNPTKKPGLDNFIPRIQEMLDGWTKVNSPTLEKLPVEVDVPEFLDAAVFVYTAMLLNLSRLSVTSY